jgi:transposase InsO family protein
MSDNGSSFVILVEGLLTPFQRRLAEFSIRRIRTQIDTPWTNGKAEAFWATSRPRCATAAISPTWRLRRPP